MASDREKPGLTARPLRARTPSVALRRPHAQQQVVRQPPRAGTGTAGLPLERIGQSNRKQSRLARRQQQGWLAEMIARGRLRAEHAGAPFGDVEIDLENA